MRERKSKTRARKLYLMRKWLKKSLKVTKVEIKNQKGIEQAVKADVAKSEIKKAKQDLIDLLGLDMVEKMYKDKVKYDVYCLKMLNIRAKGMIVQKKSFKANDLHLGEWKEVMEACAIRTGAG
ncbi:hypothetical protein Tco_1068910 [Tanacetum coccineum]|uniref:Uncharacterized protein n=1 Tax=Tanacetum coccineum TaxID=301880 RepID=A0ABQ5HGZ9_9ASTR